MFSLFKMFRQGIVALEDHILTSRMEESVGSTRNIKEADGKNQTRRGS